MESYDVAMVGLGVMGANLLLNMEDHGFSGVGFDIDPEAVQRFLEGPGRGRRLAGATTYRELADKLERPRRVFLMVPAGKPVDAVLEALVPLLDEDDVVVDCGNSHFADTERRGAALAGRGLHFVGMGVSGGEEGARHGPSLMPGGPGPGYDMIFSALEAIAAKVESGPCVAYIGPGASGHYVKMVHNGIEYGDMQLIAEAYDLLARLGGLDHEALAGVFDEWNAGDLESFLIEITARILRQRDPEGDGPLLARIKDTASMKGTGSWTVQDATALGVPVPTITAAVEARTLSAYHAERQAAAGLLPRADAAGPGMGRREWIEAVGAALYCAKACSYAQGFALLRGASQERGWEIDPAEVARIWRGGCIIRARLLGSIQEAFRRDPALPNLLVAPFFREALAGRVEAWRRVVGAGMATGIPLPAMSASLAYFDGYRAARLPANLVAAQRDLFGAHGYERLDREGTFHTQWE